MFGGFGLGSVYGGEDVNAGTEDTGGGGDAGGGGGGVPSADGYSGLYPSGYMGSDTGQSTVNPNLETDPAYQAQQDASMSSDYYSQQASDAGNKAQALAGGIGKAVGFSSAVGGLVGYRYKRLRKFQRAQARAYAQQSIDNSQRAIDQYKQDSQIQQQRLQQSYASRGVGNSSMQQEGMQYYMDTEARKQAALDQNLQLAKTNQLLTESQISVSYAEVWNSFGNAVMSLF